MAPIVSEAHLMAFSSDAGAMRAFLRDGLELDSVLYEPSHPTAG